MRRPPRLAVCLVLCSLLLGCRPRASANDGDGGSNNTNDNVNGNVNDNVGIDAGPDCGNGSIDPGEACDGADLGGETCVSLGYLDGVLSCATNCTLDETLCYNVQPVCGNGVVEPGEVCDDGNTVDDLTCAADCLSLCSPGVGSCNGDTGTFCDWNGTDLLTEHCDPLQGMSCNPATGRCDGVCSPLQLGFSYIGCDYYPTVTSNAELANKSVFTFAVAVSNTGTQTANVTITKGSATEWSGTVAAGALEIVDLPWIVALSDLRLTNYVPEGAYRVRSDQPVTVYQYNPLQYTDGAVLSYTNDAALLFPTNTWTGDYMVVSRWSWPPNPGFYTITARDDNTTVIVSPSSTGVQVQSGFGINSNGTGTVTLHAGDVIQVMGSSGASCDHTGTLISADKPVQVIGGHVCTNIPTATIACDHLEESIPPLQTVGHQYVVTAPQMNAMSTKAQFVRVIATAANTTVTYDPPQAGAPASLAAAGEWFEIGPTDADFQITASQPVLVSQYMQGRAATIEDIGDPSMALAVAVFQYRQTYLFHAPTNYDANYVNITAPAGAAVTLDGANVTGWTSIGSTGYRVARLQLSNAGNGNHTVTSTQPAGISVYGYGIATSYWYPGGLNLLDVP